MLRLVRVCRASITRAQIPPYIDTDGLAGYLAPPVIGDWLSRQTPMLSAPMGHSRVLGMWGAIGVVRPQAVSSLYIIRTYGLLEG